MSDQLAEVGRRIVTVHQLGAVVNAMRGIAGARAQQSRALLPAVRAYAEIAAHAIGQARALGTGAVVEPLAAGRPALIVFGAEQSFAGAFAEQAIEAAGDAFTQAHVLLVGSRTAALAAERGKAVARSFALPARATSLPALAMQLLDAIYAYLDEVGPVPINLVYAVWSAGKGVQITHRRLLPFDPGAFPSAGAPLPPLVNLPPAELVARLGEEYAFAQLCEAAIEAFAAENEARMATMAAAKTAIDGKLIGLQAEERLIRQEQITAEVIELAAGAHAFR